MMENATDLIKILKDWIDIFQALLTPAIALLVAYIAYQQWCINKNRLKHELFDRRYHMFELVRDFIGKITSYSRIDEQDRLKFYRATRGSRFIFDEKIAKYIEDINQGAVSIVMLYNDIQLLEAAIAQGIDKEEEKDRTVRKLHDTIDSFPKRLDEIEAYFEKYLKSKH